MYGRLMDKEREIMYRRYPKHKISYGPLIFRGEVPGADYFFSRIPSPIKSDSCVRKTFA